MFSSRKNVRRSLIASRKNHQLGLINRAQLSVETLEDRFMPSATAMIGPEPLHAAPAGGMVATPNWWIFGNDDHYYGPAQIRKAYGIDNVQLDGTGQTIAIVDANDNPYIKSDLQHFDAINGIKDPPSFAEFKEHTNGAFMDASVSGSGLVAKQNWVEEIDLDVEYAHAIAPGAKIILVETQDTLFDLFQGVDFARRQAGVSVVSMSWGAHINGLSGEFGTEQQFDPIFTTPSGHAAVSFVGSTSDTGAAVQYPSTAPTVLAVGGTTLQVDDNGVYSSESAWNSGGGGVSDVEKAPAFQTKFQTYGMRTVPDVAYNADPHSGFQVYCQYDDSFFGGPGIIVGGTSAGAPQWAGLTALVNQGRANNHQQPLANLVQDVYNLPAGDFHDVTDGYIGDVTKLNQGHWAHDGYDLATGRGTPKAASIVADLMKAEPVIKGGLAGRIAATKIISVLQSGKITFHLPVGVITQMQHTYANPGVQVSAFGKLGSTPLEAVHGSRTDRAAVLDMVHTVAAHEGRDFLAGLDALFGFANRLGTDGELLF